MILVCVVRKGVLVVDMVVFIDAVREGCSWKMNVMFWGAFMLLNFVVWVM